MAKTKKGFFIVLEGGDRSGKSTQAKKLFSYLKKLKKDVIHTREPGGTLFAEGIRKLLLDPRHHVLPLTEVLLYEAARAQHTFDKVLPALKKGKTVLCERYTMSTVVYQGYGRKIPMKTVNALNTIATGGLKPDLTIVFDMRVNQFDKRSKYIVIDRVEKELSKKRNKIKNVYRKLAKSTKNTVLIDANESIEEVQMTLRKKLTRLGIK
jgi:dTMP kinase